MSEIIPTLEYYKHYADVTDPKFGSEDAACFDISAYLAQGMQVTLYNPNNEKVLVDIQEDRKLHIPPHYRAMIPTGLTFVIPAGWSVRVHARSGNAIKLGLVLANGEGIIDWGYWQEAFQPMINTSNVDLVVGNGDRVCQAEILKDIKVLLSSTDQKPVQRTDRVGGFGSTQGMSAVRETVSQ